MKEIKENSCRRRQSCAPELLGSCPTEPVLTARADRNAALDFTPNKVTDNPPTLERIKDIALHHQEELHLGFLSQKNLERYSSPMCALDEFSLACAKHLHLLSVVQNRCSCLAALWTPCAPVHPEPFSPSMSCSCVK